MSLRRSSRLMAKDQGKTSKARSILAQGLSSSSSNGEEEEGGDSESEGEIPRKRIVTVTPSSRSRRTPQKANNFTKIYNSYNKDYGLDVYEGDFIDDDEVQYSTPKRKTSKSRQRRPEGKRKRSRVKEPSSSSGSEFEVEKKIPKKIVESSDEEGLSPVARNGGEKASESDGSEDGEKIMRHKATRRRHHSGSQLLDSSEEEEEGEGKGGRGRKRRRLHLESDDDIDEKIEATTTRKSSRTKKLREEKEKKSEAMFRKLRESRQGKQDDTEVSTPFETLEGNWTAFFDDIRDPDTDKLSPTLTLAEMILFPPPDDSESSEESDWIDSDSDVPVDWREALSQDDSQRRILYHPEAHLVPPGEDTFEDPMLQELVALPLVEAVCGGGGVAAVTEVMAAQDAVINAADEKGYSALMYAAEKGSEPVVKLLLRAGASTDCKDANGTSALHLAALGGWLECVETLIGHGHEVDCRDDLGWPPLLYAHFQNHQECVLALMKAKPKQLSVLGDLLKQPAHTPVEEENRKKTLKVVRSLLVSLAHEEAYYSLFNDFISQHPSVLDEDGFSFLKHCMALLSFENKRAWFRGKIRKLRDYSGGVSSNYVSLSLRDVCRHDLLSSVLKRLGNKSEVLYWRQPLSVTFEGEPGICLGPRREFFSCLVKSLAQGEEHLFQVCDDSHLSLQPYHLLSNYCAPPLPTAALERHDRLLEGVAMLIAHSVFHDETVDLHLTTPMIKQLLGHSLEHPADLEATDKSFHHTLLGLLEGSGEVEDLELTFTQTLECPWNGTTVDLPFCEGGRTLKVTDENKRDYVEELSRFKLEGCISHELKIFTSAFWKIVPRKSLEVFTPSELVLLISGVPKIDVKDWRRHTTYHGLKESDEIILWFWKLVESLREEEKALLLKFVTGSSCVPAGGFAHLQGLCGITHFNISGMPGKDKVPGASTCFNTLKLSDYSSEQHFRNKMLIAIRYGCEGFGFS